MKKLNSLDRLGVIVFALVVLGAILSACASPATPASVVPGALVGPTVVQSGKLACVRNPEHLPGDEKPRCLTTKYEGDVYSDTLEARYTLESTLEVAANQFAETKTSVIGKKVGAVIAPGRYYNISAEDYTLITAAYIGEREFGVARTSAGQYVLLNTPGYVPYAVTAVVTYPVGDVFIRTLETSKTCGEEFICDTPLTNTLFENLSPAITTTVNVDIRARFIAHDTTLQKLYEMGGVYHAVEKYFLSPMRTSRALGSDISIQEMATEKGRQTWADKLKNILINSQSGMPIEVSTVGVREVQTGNGDYNTALAKAQAEVDSALIYSSTLGLLQDISAARNAFTRDQQIQAAKAEGEIIRNLCPPDIIQGAACVQIYSIWRDASLTLVVTPTAPNTSVNPVVTATPEISPTVAPAQ